MFCKLTTDFKYILNVYNYNLVFVFYINIDKQSGNILSKPIVQNLHIIL